MIILRRRPSRGIPGIFRDQKALSKTAMTQIDACLEQIDKRHMIDFGKNVAAATEAVTAAGGQGQFRSRYGGFSVMTALRCATRGEFGPANEINAARKTAVQTPAPL